MERGIVQSSSLHNYRRLPVISPSTIQTTPNVRVLETAPEFNSFDQEALVSAGPIDTYMCCDDGMPAPQGWASLVGPAETDTPQKPSSWRLSNQRPVCSVIYIISVMYYPLH
jgi:hypothetical protein